MSILKECVYNAIEIEAEKDISEEVNGTINKDKNKKCRLMPAIYSIYSIGGIPPPMPP